MRKLWIVLTAAIFGFSGVFAAGEKTSPTAELKPWEVPNIALPIDDAFGAQDTLWLDLQKGKTSGAVTEWVLYLSAFNDESLFAISFAIRHDSLMTFDSISLAGTRIDFFQTKIVNKKTAIPNTVTVGLFTALSPGAPPVPPGKGLVTKMYYKAPAARPISIRSVAPILMPPGLEFVTPKGGSAHPVVVRLGDAVAASEVAPTPTPDTKTPAKPNKKSKKVKT